MAKVYESKRKVGVDTLTDQEIIDTVNSIVVRSKVVITGKSYAFIGFTYAGVYREHPLIRGRWQVHPAGTKASVLYQVCVEHVLAYPNDYIPRELILQVLLGQNDPSQA